jgi:hypothetical protein
MTMTPQEQARLERLISKACNELPPLEAPRSLSVRVMAQVEQRAQQPSWRAPFHQWSTSLRVSFVLIALAVMGATLSLSAGAGAQHLVTQLIAPLSQSLAWFKHFGAAMSVLAAFCRDLGAALLHGMPALWLYCVVAALLSLYALLAGISATAYRTLYTAHQSV